MSETNMKRRADWASLVANGAAVSVLGFFSGLIVAKYLNPEGRGLLATITLPSSVAVSLACMSLNSAAAYHCAKSKKLKENIAIGSILFLSVPFSILAILGVAIYFFLDISKNQYIYSALIFATVIIPFDLLRLLISGVDRGYQNLSKFRRSQIGVPVVYCILLMTFIALEKISVESVLFCLGAASIITTVDRVFSRNPFFFRIDFSLVKSLLSTGAKFHLATVLSVLCSQLDKFFIVSSTDATEIGLYFVAMTLATAPVGVIGQASSVLMTAYVAANSDEDDREKLISTSIKSQILILLFCSPFVIILTYAIVRFILGSAYSNVINLVPIILLGSSLAQIQNVINAASQGRNDSIPQIGGFSAYMICFILFYFISEPAINAIEVAKLYSFSSLLGVSFAFFVFFKRANYHPASFWPFTRKNAVDIFLIIKRFVLKNKI